MTWQRIDEDTYIDDTLVTCAEYQLFIDEMREQGQYYQPDHWTSYQFLTGKAQEPMLGVRHSDAKTFCWWLTQREIGNWQYRLPHKREIEEFQLQLPEEKGILGYWSIDTHIEFIDVNHAHANLYPGFHEYVPNSVSELANAVQTARSTAEKLLSHVIDDIENFPSHVIQFDYALLPNYFSVNRIDRFLVKNRGQIYSIVFECNFLESLRYATNIRSVRNLSACIQDIFRFLILSRQAQAGSDYPNEYTTATINEELREALQYLREKHRNEILYIDYAVGLSFSNNLRNANYRINQVSNISLLKELAFFLIGIKNFIPANFLNVDFTLTCQIACALLSALAVDLSHSRSTYSFIRPVYDLIFDVLALQERIAGRSPAFEGIRLVKERIK